MLILSTINKNKYIQYHLWPSRWKCCSYFFVITWATEFVWRSKWRSRFDLFWRHLMNVHISGCSLWILWFNRLWSTEIRYEKLTLTRNSNWRTLSDTIFFVCLHTDYTFDRHSSRLEPNYKVFIRYSVTFDTMCVSSRIAELTL